MAYIVVSDNHRLYCRALRVAIERSIPGAEVIEGRSIDEVASILQDYAGVELVLLATDVEGVSDLGSVSTLMGAYPDVKFAMLTAFDPTDGPVSQEPVSCLSKAQGRAEIIASLTSVLLSRVQDGGPRGAPAAQDGVATLKLFASASPESVSPHLTRRQQEVLTLIGDGLSNKEIARKLAIAEATAKIHASALMRSLRVRNRTEAAIHARELLGAR